MTDKAPFLIRIRRSYFSALNWRTIVALSITIIATVCCYQFKWIFNLDLTLVSVAVVFPLVFTLGSAFQRREKALEHLGRAKGALSAISYYFGYTKKLSEQDKLVIDARIKRVQHELIQFLSSPDNNKQPLRDALDGVQQFIASHRKSLGRSLSLRVFRLMRDVFMGIENSSSIKSHRTPFSIRAYCELFIYIFPFFYAPTLIKNIQFQGVSVQQIREGLYPLYDEHLTWMILALNLVISFILITLYNVQEQIENPFDQNGIDDIQLENYEIDYT